MREIKHTSKMAYGQLLEFYKFIENYRNWNKNQTIQHK